MASGEKTPARPPDPGSGPAAAVIAVGERLIAAALAAARSISARRGMTSVAVGVLIVAVAWVGERDGAWGFPMLVAGGALIALGLIGPRLSGSLAVRWGEDGAQLNLSTTIAPPGRRHSAPALPGGDADADRPAPLMPPTEIEGDAETIEFNVEALKQALGVAEPVAGTAERPAGD